MEISISVPSIGLEEQGDLPDMDAASKVMSVMARAYMMMIMR